MDALLHNGADISIQDMRGRTALHLSAMCGHVGLLGSLLLVCTDGCCLARNVVVVDELSYLRYPKLICRVMVVAPENMTCK